MNNVTTNNNLTINTPFQNIASTITTAANPYYSNVAWGPMRDITSSTLVLQVVNKMPIILKVDKYKVLKDNRVRIYFSKISHKSKQNKFLPDIATLYFGSDLYGVYSKGDYRYWKDNVIVEFKDKYAEILDTCPIFTIINNFDFEITNEEVAEFIEDLDNYSDYAHCLLEEMLIDSGQYNEKYERLLYHQELDKQLF